MGLPVIALAVTAASAIGGGIAAGKAASYQGQVAANNATTARQNAAYAASAGSSQTQQAGLKARAQTAGVRAGEAANNLDVSSGSAADVQTSQRELGALDTATVANNAALEAYGYQTQAAGFQAQAGLDKSEAQYDPIAGVLGAAGSVLGSSSANSLFGGSGAGGAGAESSQTFDAGATGAPQSLLSGFPQVPSDYQWMQSTSPGGLY